MSRAVVSRLFSPLRMPFIVRVRLHVPVPLWVGSGPFLVWSHHANNVVTMFLTYVSRCVCTHVSLRNNASPPKWNCWGVGSINIQHAVPRKGHRAFVLGLLDKNWRFSSIPYLDLSKKSHYKGKKKERERNLLVHNLQLPEALSKDLPQ